MKKSEVLEALSHMRFKRLNYETYSKLGYTAIIDENDYEVCKIFASTNINDEWLADSICTSINWFLEKREVI